MKRKKKKHIRQNPSLDFEKTREVIQILNTPVKLKSILKKKMAHDMKLTEVDYN